jgi:probable rRNA maturation factor
MSGGLHIEIGCSSEGWAGALPDAETLLHRAANATWEAAGSGTAELSVMLSSDTEIQALNRDYRGKDKPTNVLSFPAGDEGAAGRPRLLGDVVLALETIKREAAAQSKPLADHLSHLTVHGVLHLLGHDHETETQATAMEALETEILHGLGIADPYTVTDEPVG